MGNTGYKSESELAREDAAEVQTLPAGTVVCPRCGWSNTRLSFTKTPLDTVLQVFAVRAFRCRCCGNRFHAFHRTPSSD
jgi:hypothetical protein